MTNPQKSVELFHLLFLRHLSERLEKDLYAIKGGCNLRFFYKSIRYSEDLDIDVKTISKETLQNKVNKLFENQSFQQTLSMKGMQIDRLSEAKQTETTQRWKLSIKLPGISATLPTKIEFSRRKTDDICIFEQVDPELIQRYQLYPILINHYSQEAAFCQKIDALIHRTEVQARDIFDIQVLLIRGVNPECLTNHLRKELNIAIMNTLSINFSEFKSQVVSYLMEEYKDHYNSINIWNETQQNIISILKEIKPL